jgi:hypothetical protein
VFCIGCAANHQRGRARNSADLVAGSARAGFRTAQIRQVS